MGLAATQMRFLALTAKKSNSEYQGQQINQQRLNIANQSSNIYSTIADMTVPIPPPQAIKNETVNAITINGVNVPAGQYYVPYTTISSDGTTTATAQAGTDPNAIYNTAYSAYETSLANYNAKMAALEAESENVHQKDKKLELQLKRIDTEHSAIQTEIDAVKKILDDNVESSFKTFG